MKKISYLLLALALGITNFSCSSDDSGTPVTETPSDQELYYAGVDFTKQGLDLKEELARSVADKHTNPQKYQWNHLQETDLTEDGKEVYLIYGHKGVTEGDKAYTRDKDNKGGTKGNWNREHVFAKSLGNPKLNDKKIGAGTDAHNLRPSDLTWNATRGNFKFIQGEGFSGLIDLEPGQHPTDKYGWYPGDEWKGDVARMMMYMYIRYGEQCLPTAVAYGEANQIDENMVELLLDWNAEDPVSAIEVKRNTYHGNLNNEFAQGNRNPFIDNPNLATQIWGGKEAENLWK